MAEIRESLGVDLGRLIDTKPWGMVVTYCNAYTYELICRRGEFRRSAKPFYELELRISQKSRVTTKSQLSSTSDFVIGFKAMTDGCVLESTSSMFLTINQKTCH